MLFHNLVHQGVKHNFRCISNVNVVIEFKLYYGHRISKYLHYVVEILPLVFDFHMSVRKSAARSHDVKDGLDRLLLHSVQSFLCSKFCSYCSYIMHNLSTSLCKKCLLHLHIMVDSGTSQNIMFTCQCCCSKSQFKLSCSNFKQHWLSITFQGSHWN